MDMIEYLEYLLTDEGLKPLPQKVQVILELQSPTINKPLQILLGHIVPPRYMGEEKQCACIPQIKLGNTVILK